MSSPRDAATAQLCAQLSSLLQSSAATSTSTIPAAPATPPAAGVTSPALPPLPGGHHDDAMVSDLFDQCRLQAPSSSSTPSRSLFPSSAVDNSQSGPPPGVPEVQQQMQVAVQQDAADIYMSDTQAQPQDDAYLFACPVGGINFETGSTAGVSSLSVSLEENLLDSSLDTPQVMVSQEEVSGDEDEGVTGRPQVADAESAGSGTKDVIVNPSTPAMLAFHASLDDIIMPFVAPSIPAATPHVPNVKSASGGNTLPPLPVDEEEVVAGDQSDKESDDEQGGGDGEDAAHVSISSSQSDSERGDDDSGDPTYQPPKGDVKRRRFLEGLSAKASGGSGTSTRHEGNTEPGVGGTQDDDTVVVVHPVQPAVPPAPSTVSVLVAAKQKSPTTTTRAVHNRGSRTGVLSRTSAWVWEYFSVPDGLTVATAEQVPCKLCRRMVKRGILESGFTLGTSALVSHMRTNHKAEFRLHDHDGPSPRKTAQGTARPSGASTSSRQTHQDVVDQSSSSVHARPSLPPPPKAKRARKTKADRGRAMPVSGGPSKESQVLQHFVPASGPVPGSSTTIPNVQSLYLHTYLVCALCHGVISSGETVGSARFAALASHMRTHHPDSMTAEGEAVRPTVPSAVRPLPPAAADTGCEADVDASQEDDSDNAV